MGDGGGTCTLSAPFSSLLPTVHGMCKAVQNIWFYKTSVGSKGNEK
jgi:hypothetical protein